MCVCCVNSENNDYFEVTWNDLDAELYWLPAGDNVVVLPACLPSFNDCTYFFGGYVQHLGHNRPFVEALPQLACAPLLQPLPKHK